MAIVLMSFGKQGYGYAAYNLALSLRYHKTELPIILCTDGIATQSIDLSVFDKIIKIPETLSLTRGKVDPGKVKVHLYDFIKDLPYEEFLYLDVDALALQSVDSMFDSFKDGPFYQTDVLGTGKKGDTINYAIWAKHEEIWPFFDLKEDSIYPAIQSSYAYVRKGKEAEEFFEVVKMYYSKGFPLNKILMPWGGTMPDELMFSGACAKLNVIPASPIRPIFFGWKIDKRSYTELAKAYKLLSIYGNGTAKTLTKLRYWEWYDRLLRKYTNNGFFFKSITIKRDKHANA